jgi:serine/threonine protein kinase
VAKPEETDLLQVAASIVDGAPVDWAGLSTPPDHEHASVLHELKLLDRIVTFHREDDELATADALRDRSADSTRPLRWGHFQLLNKVGEGTFGVVYRAWDTTLEKEVALKLLLPTPTRSFRILLTEARRLARVQHPNVVKVYGTDEINGHAGIWMEFVKGRSLANILKSQGQFGAREAAGIGVDLCRALAAVHAAGLMHGDIKAHNIMREGGGRTVLMDFGTVKDLDAPDAAQPAKDDFAGTPLYVAPEVFAGQPRTKRADIYSLGVLLYHLVSNAYPVEGDSRAALEQAHRRGERTRLRDARPDLPEEFVYAVERALSIDPQARFASAGEFEAALARFLVGPSEVKAPARRSMSVMLPAIAALVCIAGIAYWLEQRRGSGKPSDALSTSASAVSPRPPAVVPAAAVESAYQIDTAVYRVRGKSERRLHPGERVALGDGLFVKLRVSMPTYVYIVNEDDQGESYLLFPQPGQTVANPVPAGLINRIPGTGGNAEFDWQVSSVGGREHFLIFASPERVPALEDVFATLPRPEIGRTPRPPRLPEEAIRRLRGVGGLTARPSEGAKAKLSPLFSTPLGETEETARGLWVRQLTIDNPVAGR